MQQNSRGIKKKKSWHIRNIWKFEVAREDGSHGKRSTKWHKKVGWGHIKYQDEEYVLNFIGNRKLTEGSIPQFLFCFGQKQICGCGRVGVSEWGRGPGSVRGTWQLKLPCPFRPLSLAPYPFTQTPWAGTGQQRTRFPLHFFFFKEKLSSLCFVFWF